MTLAQTARPLANVALPTGGKIVSGAASINQSNTVLTVTQKSAQLVANWDTFNIGASAEVQFVQPGAQSVALNRVLGSDASQIEGRLQANGQVFLINPNGIIFAKNAHVDVGGIVATTLSLGDRDFLAGHDTFESADTPASVDNQGVITSATGGYVVLAATRVTNSGQIDAPRGSVALAAGSRVALAIGRTGLLSVSVEAAATNAVAQNSGLLRADGGMVQMSASTEGAQPAVSLLAGGTIEARSIAQRAGRVFLDGGHAGSVDVTGTLDASGLDPGSSGGQVSITGQAVELVSTAAVDAAGAAGGGTIEVGGGMHGAGALPHASVVGVAKGATLNASATQSGDGGTIAIWSDGRTQVSGALQAKGAGAHASGGFIETSGHDLTVTGMSVNASSALGKAGTWLLDPYDLTVTASATTISPAPTGTWTSGSTGSNVLNTDINNALNAGTAVVLQTSGSLGDGAGNGDITIGAPIAKTSGADTSLSLLAGGSILINSAISSTFGALAVTLDANTLLGGGYINIAAPVTTLGGALVIGGGAAPASVAAVGTAVQASGVRIADLIDSGGADVVVNGNGQNSAGNGNVGIFVAASGAILSHGGSVTLRGSGGGSGLGEHGIFIDTGATVAAAGGGVSITGSASPFGTGSGVYLNGAASTISTTGSANLTIIGTAAGDGAEIEYGTYLGAGSSVATVDGLASVTGINNTLSTVSGQTGVNVVAGAAIVSGGSGGISVVGTGGGQDTTGADYGVFIGGAGGIQATLLGGNSPISISGVGGDNGASGSGNVGVKSLSALVGNGGAVSITGTGGASSGGANIGIQMGAVSNTGAGAITFDGRGGSFAGGVNGGNAGVYLAGAVTAVSGPILLSGNGGNTAGANNVGISVQSGVTASGTGDIALFGVGAGAGVSAHGVYINGKTISSQGGAVAVTGFATTQAAGIGSGVYFFGPASTVSTNVSGGVDVTGHATGGASEVDYGVYLGNASSLISAVNGLITVTGTNATTSTTTGQIGVAVVTGASIRSTGTGGISVMGTGGGRDTTGNDYGVLVSSSSGIRATLAAGNSPITISGTGGDSGGTGSNNYGVSSAALAGNGGPITVTGSGGNSSGAFNYGIAYGAGITNTGSGAIRLLGTGGGSGTSEIGVYVNAMAISAAVGNVAVTGFGAPLGTGSGVYMTGAASTIGSAGAGTVTVDGTGTGAGAQNVYGVNLGNASSVISTVNGLVTVTGTNTATSTTTGQIGVNVASGATIKSTGTGGITVTGVGGGSDTTGSDYGIFAPGANAIQATLAAGNSPIIITGTGGDSGGSGVSNYGVFSQGALAGNGGAIRINGTGGNSSGNSNFGINYLGAISNTGTGSITLNGTGGGSGTSERGVTINATSVAAGGGNVSVTGLGSASGTGSGVYLTGAGSSISSTGAGSVTVSGTARGSGAQATYGVFVGTATSFISAVNGLVSVTGVNTTTSATSGQLGVNIVPGAAVRSSGTGGIVVAGTGGGRDATGADYGVLIGAGNGIQATLAGGNSPITIIGTGGDAAGLGSNNDGVHAFAVLTGNGGNIAISGIPGNPGNPGASGSFGLSLAAVAAGPATLTLTSTGAATASGALTATNLALLGSGGAFTLTNAGNAVATIAAHTGSLNYLQTGDLTIGTTGATVGVTNSGSVLINVAGNLTLAMGTLVSAGGAGNALQLIDSGRFTNNAGAGALAVSGGGRYLVWSVTPTNDARGALAPGFIQYGATFGSAVLADATQNGFLYSTPAVVSVGLVGAVSKVYDTTDAASLVAANYTASGLLGGDTLILNNPTAGTYDSIHVGIGKSVTVPNLSIVSVTNAGATVYGYTLASTTASGAVGRITAAALSVALTGSVAKVYDTTDVATLQPANYLLTGVLGGDVVNLNNPATGTYDSIHVGSGKTVSVAGLALSGANASDYSLAPTTVAGPVGLITGALVTAGLAGTVSKVYDGTNGAVLAAANYTMSGVIGSDVVSLNDPGMGTYDDIHAGTGKTVSVTGLALAGANSADYLLAADTVSAAVGIIATRPITLTADPKSRLYGVANPPLTYAATSGSLVNGDLLSGAPTTAATKFSNVGSYAITRGTLAATSDYALSFVDGTLSIGQQAITILSNAGQGKTYGADDPTAASTAYTIASGTLVNNDLLSGSMGRAPGETVGSYVFTRGSTGVADGNGGANYLITFDGTSHPFSIARAALGATLGGATKVYGTDDPLVGAIAPVLTGLINRTVVDINGTSTAVDDTGHVAATVATLTRAAGEDVGSHGITSATFNALTGSASANYAAPTLSGAPTLAITAAPLGVTIAGQTKTYGADDPALSGITPLLTGLINRSVSTWNGSVAINDSAAVSSSLASLARAGGESVGSYNVTGATFQALTGAAAANYSAPTLTGVPTLAISAAPLSATFANQTKVYGADDSTLSGITPALSGLINRTVNTWNGDVSIDDTAGVSTSIASLTRSGGETVGSYNVTAATFQTLAGVAAGNYGNPTLGGAPTLAITAAPLGATFANQTKVYGADDPTLSGIAPLLSGLINRTVSTWNGSAIIDDTAAVTAALASLTRAVGEDVGSYGVTGAVFRALIGPAASNYASPALTGSATLAITRAATLATIADQSKVYGNADPSAGSIAVTIVPVDRSVATWNGAAAVADSGKVSATLSSLSRVPGKNVGRYAYTSGTLAALSGSSAANYSTAVGFSNSPTLLITPRALSVTALAANDKTYDATMVAILSGGALSGVVSGDSVALTVGMGRFADSNAGSGKSVAASNVSLSGRDSLNYTLTPVTGLTASIIPAALTVAAQTNTKSFDGNTSAAAIPNVSGLQGTDTALSSETYGDAEVGSGKTLNPAVAISDGNGGSNYRLVLVTNNGGVITAANVPTLPVDTGAPYLPVAGGRGDIDGDAAGPVTVLQPGVEPGLTHPLLSDRSGSTTLAQLSGTARSVRSSLDVNGELHTVLTGGHTYLVTYSDGSASSILITDGHDRSMHFAVPETERALRVTFPVAEHREIFARAAVHIAGGRVSVTLSKASGTLPRAPSTPDANVKYLDVRMTGDDHTELKFALSFAHDLRIEPRNATAAAALAGATRNESILDLVLAEAIVKLVNDWQVSAIPGARIEN